MLQGQCCQLLSTVSWLRRKTMRSMGLLALVPVCGARERDIDTGHTPGTGLRASMAHQDNSLTKTTPFPPCSRDESPRSYRWKCPVSSASGIHSCPCPRPSPRAVCDR